MGVDSVSGPVTGARAERLRGWKEIGRWFGVDERTVKRWEASRGLPVHRVPGEPRAPVFAYAHELKAWVERDGEVAAPEEAIAEPAARRPWLALALLFLLVAVGSAVWLGMRAADGERLASAQTEDLKRLAGAQVAALNDELESQPGTVAVRGKLAGEAVQVLGRVAALPDASPELKREASEGYRRLAVLQNALDRPSLRDRPASRQSLAEALKLLEEDRSAEARAVRTRVQIEASRQASGAGDLKAAEKLLGDASAAAKAAGGGLADDWALAESEYLGWKGDYAASAAAAAPVTTRDATDPVGVLRQLRALDLEAEAAYYLGDLQRSLAGYGRAVEAAEAALGRWPNDSRLRWMLLRQQWNLGATLIEAGRPLEAETLLAQSLAGWEALAAADPSDGAVQSWVRAVRLSHGQALGEGGNFAAAIPELSLSVAERRRWLAERPEDADARRMLVKALATFADALAPAGRAAEACALLGEAEAMAATMEKARQLTGYDKAETLRMMGESRRRYCPASVARE
ncbi:hypothetical protein [Sandaracinobacteroides hominis]|uniref:hypothetical protein n=1 Tax=Sandaracinobacteroides hominis TaxID=2780086 RepID=UPI0018F61648|nr:hypothetical protein [Sandaracinobacteroides hominis]